MLQHYVCIMIHGKHQLCAVASLQHLEAKAKGDCNEPEPEVSEVSEKSQGEGLQFESSMVRLPSAKTHDHHDHHDHHDIQYILLAVIDMICDMIWHARWPVFSRYAEIGR